VPDPKWTKNLELQFGTSPLILPISIAV